MSSPRRDCRTDRNNPPSRVQDAQDASDEWNAVNVHLTQNDLFRKAKNGCYLEPPLGLRDRSHHKGKRDGDDFFRNATNGGYLKPLPKRTTHSAL